MSGCTRSLSWLLGRTGGAPTRAPALHQLNLLLLLELLPDQLILLRTGTQRNHPFEIGHLALQRAHMVARNCLTRRAIGIHDLIAACVQRVEYGLEILADHRCELIRAGIRMLEERRVDRSQCRMT